jgi:nicotinate-nucleotide adenylyltransferase
VKIAVFGGSFDPPHIAHVMACAYILTRSDAERVLMIPCARHPFGKQLVSFEHRFAMCQLAVEGVCERIDVSDIEAARHGASYMVDTLDELIARRPQDTFELVIGSDITEEIVRWKDYDRIRQMVPFFVLPRLEEATLPEAVSSNKFVLPNISSTEIRARLAAGDVPRELLPRRVAEYIARHRLYGVASETAHE